jgi:hypothetical protein
MDTRESTDEVTLSKIDETRETVSAKLNDIGAYRDNVHPLFKNILEAVKP